MPKTRVEKSILIEKPAADVYSKIRDFKEWKPWSPWLMNEPDAKVNYADDGKFYEWEGEIIGAGSMSILSEVENQEMHCELLFLKPWKSKAGVSFFLKEENGNTKVTWTMDGSLPFFMFWMKKMMEVFIGMDYNRGLNMLKDYVEDGKVHSNIEFNGIENYAGCQYVGIKTTGAISQLDKAMEKDFTKLMTYFMQNHKDKMAGHAFSIYHKWEPVKDRVAYTAAVPVNSIPEDLPEGTFVGNVPSTKVNKMTHTGPYRHVGNIWSAQIAHQRAKVFKQNKKMHPMEVYLNSPKDTPELELKSEVLFPAL